MPFCTKCGTEVPENVKFCPQCGNALQVASPPTAKPATATASTEYVEELSLFGYWAKCFKNYVNFKGRARRKEFWGFFLFNFIFMIALLVIGTLFPSLEKLYPLYIFASLLPNLAVTVRRLHDINESGWLVLLAIAPIVGMLILIIVYLCKDSSGASNMYGPSPKYAD
jgi:uncharacterized membrane protein YhaH (DUF805 family)